MIRTYVVTYDISDPKRLRRVFQTMKGYGEHLQLSVFICQISHKRLVRMRTELENVIDHRADQVLIVDLGPTDGLAKDRILALGLPFHLEKHHALIV